MVLEAVARKVVPKITVKNQGNLEVTTREAAPKITAKNQGNPEAEARQRLATERRLAQDLAALQAENRKEEIDRMQAGTEKKLAQDEYDYDARKEEINRQEADWKRENKEAGLSTGDNGLTREQQDELEKARASNTASRKKAETDVYREEAEAMNAAMSSNGI